MIANNVTQTDPTEMIINIIIDITKLMHTVVLKVSNRKLDV